MKQVDEARNAGETVVDQKTGGAIASKQCEVREDSRCKNIAAVLVREPFTPRGFLIRCCEKCAGDLIAMGYARVF